MLSEALLLVEPEHANAAAHLPISMITIPPIFNVLHMPDSLQRLILASQMTDCFRLPFIGPTSWWVHPALLLTSILHLTDSNSICSILILAQTCEH